MSNIPRIKKYNTITSIEYYSFDSFNGFIDLNKSEIESLLAQMDENSIITIDIERGYDDCIDEISLSIYNVEDESDEDYNRRVDEINKAKLMKEQFEKKRKEERELALYKELKKRYG